MFGLCSLNYMQIGPVFVNLAFLRWKKLGFCALSYKGDNLGSKINLLLSRQEIPFSARLETHLDNLNFTSCKAKIASRVALSSSSVILRILPPFLTRFNQVRAF